MKFGALDVFGTKKCQDIRDQLYMDTSLMQNRPAPYDPVHMLLYGLGGGGFL